VNSRILQLLCLLLHFTPCAEAGPLRTLAEVHALSPDAAGCRLNVEVDGVVIYCDPSTGGVVIHDGTAACYAFINFSTPVPPPLPKFGDRIHLKALTHTGGFSTYLTSDFLSILGHGTIPEPHRLEAEEIYLPRIDAAWIEVPATIVGVESGGIAYTLTIEIYGQTFKADVPPSPDAVARASALMQRPAIMRAVLGTVFNPQRQMIGRHFYVPSFDAFQPISPAANSTSLPYLTVVELLSKKFGPTDPIRVEGVITQNDAKGFHLRDTSGSAQVQAAMPTPFPPGTRVSIEGYGAIAPFRPLLRATKVTHLADGPPPPPVPLNFDPNDTSLLQMELVSVTAYLLGSRTIKDETILQCRSNDTIFEAIIPNHHNTPLPEYIPGDQLKLIGICELTTTHPLPRPEWVNGFRIRLANTAAITLLHRAPWWNQTRLLTALAAMTGLTLLGSLGTFFFRRVVRKQAHIIGEKIGDEAVNLERDRMARDLHDNLEQQLAGVALQLDGLDKVAKADPSQISHRLSLARRMLRHTRVEARRSVWDLRSRVLEIQGLRTALNSMAKGASSDGGPTVVLDIDEITRPLPTGSDFHLLRIAQEALANAIKHAAAHEVTISLRETADAITLRIQDDGQGFNPAPPHASSTAHFGILGMHERVEKINACLNIQSAPGHGCTVTVSLPHPSIS